VICRVGRWSGAGWGGGTGPGSFLPLCSQLLQLLLYHFLVLLLVHCLATVFLQLLLVLLARLQEPLPLVIILLLYRCEFSFQFLLVHRQALYLPPQHLHPGRGDDTANVRHHGLREDLIDQPVIPHEPGVDQVLDGQPVVWILVILGRLDVDPSLHRLSSPGCLGRSRLLWVLYDRSSSTLGLHVGLKRRTVVILLQRLLVLDLFHLVFICELRLLAIRKISPHCPYNLSNFPQLEVCVLILDTVPHLPAVPHVWHQGLLRSLWWFWGSMRCQRFGSDFLWVEGGVAVLLLNEGVGLDFILHLLLEEIRPSRTSWRGLQTFLQDIERDWGAGSHGMGSRDRRRDNGLTKVGQRHLPLWKVY